MMHMYVWSRKPAYLAVAQAESVEAARRALLSEDSLVKSGAGSCPERDEARKAILETQPNIWFGTNAEFALTDSAELREHEDWASKQIANKDAEILRLHHIIAAAGGQGYLEWLRKTAPETVATWAANYNRVMSESEGVKP